MKISLISKAMLCVSLCLLSSSCISKSTDVSNEPLYRDIIGKKFTTKVTCKLVEYDSSEYSVAEYIAKRGKDGKLTYQTGDITGQKGKEFIPDNQVFTVEKVIRRHSLEYDYLKVIGYFPAYKKRIDVGILFTQKPTSKGSQILINSKFLETERNE